MKYLNPAGLDLQPSPNLQQFVRQQLVPAFADDSLAFIEALSARLMADPVCRAMPDLLALAFWFRSARVKALCHKYQQLPYQFKPLGLVYHNTPANVDSLFMYPALLSLLCGNVNLIRLSSRAGISADVLLSHVRALAVDFPAVQNRLQFIHADHQDQKLVLLMPQLDGRLLWGSDQAIIRQRQTPVAPHCRDLTFNHKFSLALFSAKAVLSANDSEMQQLFALFCRDNLTYAQQACASAKALLWLGDTEIITKAQQKFWSGLSQHLTGRSLLSDSEQYQALASAQQLLMQSENYQQWQQTALQRLRIQVLDELMVQLHPGCGLVLEQHLSALSDLAPQLTPCHQTLSYWGLTSGELQTLHEQTLRGIDRIVPLGQALEFSEVWDGGDLILQLSRLQFRAAVATEMPPL